MNLEGHIFLKVYVLYLSLFILNQNLYLWNIFLAFFWQGALQKKAYRDIGAVPYKVYTNTGAL